MTRHNINPYAFLNLRKQIYLECRAMAEYSLAKGCSFPASVIQHIEAFEAHDFTEEDDENYPPQIRTEIDITSLVESHDLLAKLIEPATPQTVLLLDMEQEAGTMLKFLGPVALVRQLMIVAIISLLIFIGLMSTSYINESELEQNVLSADGLAQLARLFFYMSAAGLGASFAALYKANYYISNGTYDPCYQSSYWMRFWLGIIAGLLLAVLISEKSIQNEELLSKGVIRPLLAILGGFSADLLYTFLHRMVETFKSLFEGSTKNILDAKDQEVKTRLAEQEIQSRIKLAQNLVQVQQQMGAEIDSEQIKLQINNILQNLIQTK